MHCTVLRVVSHVSLVFRFQRYGEERVVIAERDGKPGRARKVMVFLNPSANKRSHTHTRTHKHYNCLLSCAEMQRYNF